MSKLSGSLGGIVLSVALMSVTASASSAAEVLACAKKSNGALRVVDSPARCSKTENFISWAQAGQQGPSGITGPVGPQGPAGVTGAAGTSGSGIAGVHGTINADGSKATGSTFNVTHPSIGEYSITFSMPSATIPDCLISVNALHSHTQCDYSVRTISFPGGVFQLSVTCNAAILYSVLDGDDAYVLTKTLTRRGGYAAGVLESELPVNTPFSFMCMQSAPTLSSDPAITNQISSNLGVLTR